MSKLAFIQSLVSGAQQIQRDTGMFASVTIAQACQETGYGASTPKDKDTGEESYNLFGRKISSPSDPKVYSLTWEVYATLPKNYVKYVKLPSGNYKVWVYDYFKKFNSFSESVVDRASFLKLKYYAKACASLDPFDACDFLIHTGYFAPNGKEIGYATDENYVTALKKMITSWDLTQYDLPKTKGAEDDMDKPMILPDWQWRQLYAYVGDAVNKGLVEWSWCQKIVDRTLTPMNLMFLMPMIEGRSRGLALDPEKTYIPAWDDK